MSTFIVINTTTTLDYIVDGMQYCRPHNPNVRTLVSIGNFLHEEDGVYYQCQTIGTTLEEVQNQSKEDCSSESNLKDLLQNQLAHTRRLAAMGQRQINIILLENPQTQESDYYGNLVYNTLREIEDERLDPSIHIIRTCFTFDANKPQDVAINIPREYITTRQTSIKGTKHHLLLIDNEDTKWAATSGSKESYTLMIQHALMDFMMLLSSDSSRYQLANSLNSSTQVFALGYAECFYYYPDIQTFYKFANCRDLLRYMLTSDDLHTADDDKLKEELDIEKVPYGLYQREERMDRKYRNVPFYKNIDAPEYADNIDKKIDDIIRELQPIYEAFRNAKIEEAYQIDLGKYQDKKGQIIEKAKHKAREEAECVGEDVEVAIQTAIDEIETTYPMFIRPGAAEEEAIERYIPYIDRTIIYTYPDNPHNSEEDDEDNLCFNNLYAKEYNRLIDIIKSKDFLLFVEGWILQKESHQQLEAYRQQVQADDKKGCLRRLMFWQKEEENLPTELPQMLAENTISTAKTISDSYKNRIASITEMQKKRRQYFAFKDELKTIVDEYNTLMRIIDPIGNQVNPEPFRLTTHCKSFDYMIDLKLLKTHQAKDYESRQKRIQAQWLRQLPKEQTRTTLKEIAQQDTYNEYEQYKFIDWKNPFPFVKDWSPENDINLLINELLRRSYPFLNFHDEQRMEAANLICKNTYSDNDALIQPIKNRQIDIENPNSVQGTFSTHTESKICLFQILQVDDLAWNGIVDIREQNNEEL